MTAFAPIPACALAASVLTWTVPALAASYGYTSLDAPGQYLTTIVGNPQSINDSDQVVGSTEDAAGHYQGFVWQNGQFTLFQQCDILQSINANGLAVGYIAPPVAGYCTVDTRTGRTLTYPVQANGNLRLLGINTARLVLADIVSRADITQGLTLAGKKTVKFAVPGSQNKYGGTFPSGLNDSGTIAGWYSDAAGAVHGFTTRSGGYDTFDVPGSSGTYPYVITADGTLGGGYLAGGQQTGFLRSGTSATTISPPGALTSYVTGIGPGGEVVGTWEDGSQAFHGFVLRGGIYTQIDMPGAVHTSIDGVNALGSLVGSYYDPQLLPHAFIAQCKAGLSCTQ